MPRGHSQPNISQYPAGLLSLVLSIERSDNREPGIDVQLVRLGPEHQLLVGPLLVLPVIENHPILDPDAWVCASMRYDELHCAMMADLGTCPRRTVMSRGLGIEPHQSVSAASDQLVLLLRCFSQVKQAERQEWIEGGAV